MKNQTIIMGLVLSVVTSIAMAAENTSPSAQAVNSSCTQEAQTAGCGSEKVGTGLLKCIHQYKKEHKKEFKISESCKDSMKKLREEKKSK